jgi:hypothetical protein
MVSFVRIYAHAGGKSHFEDLGGRFIRARSIRSGKAFASLRMTGRPSEFPTALRQSRSAWCSASSPLPR